MLLLPAGHRRRLAWPIQATATFASLPCPTHLLPSCSPQNLSNFLWAFAKLGVKSNTLFVEGAHAGRLGLGRDSRSFLPHGCSCAACCACRLPATRHPSPVPCPLQRPLPAVLCPAPWQRAGTLRA